MTSHRNNLSKNKTSKRRGEAGGHNMNLLSLWIEDNLMKFIDSKTMVSMTKEWLMWQDKQNPEWGFP